MWLSCYFFFFFFNDTATTEIYTLSLHDALPICRTGGPSRHGLRGRGGRRGGAARPAARGPGHFGQRARPRRVGRGGGGDGPGTRAGDAAPPLRGGGPRRRGGGFSGGGRLVERGSRN